jgi:hypothetical protein
MPCKKCIQSDWCASRKSYNDDCSKFESDKYRSIELNKLKIGDKFRLADVPYLVIDMDMKNFSLCIDYSNFTAVLNLISYKVMAFDSKTKVNMELDNLYV